MIQNLDFPTLQKQSSKVFSWTVGVVVVIVVRFRVFTFVGLYQMWTYELQIESNDRIGIGRIQYHRPCRQNRRWSPPPLQRKRNVSIWHYIPNNVKIRLIFFGPQNQHHCLQRCHCNHDLMKRLLLPSEVGFCPSWTQACSVCTYKWKSMIH